MSSWHGCGRALDGLENYARWRCTRPIETEDILCARPGQWEGVHGAAHCGCDIMWLGDDILKCFSLAFVQLIAHLLADAVIQLWHAECLIRHGE